MEILAFGKDRDLWCAMDVILEVRYPYTATHRTLVSVDVPDDAESIDTWINDHKFEIMKKEGFAGDESELSKYLDLGIAGIDIVEPN